VVAHLAGIGLDKAVQFHDGLFGLVEEDVELVLAEDDLLVHAGQLLEVGVDFEGLLVALLADVHLGKFVERVFFLGETFDEVFLGAQRLVVGVGLLVGGDQLDIVPIVAGIELHGLFAIAPGVFVVAELCVDLADVVEGGVVFGIQAQHFLVQADGLGFIALQVLGIGLDKKVIELGAGGRVLAATCGLFFGGFGLVLFLAFPLALGGEGIRCGYQEEQRQGDEDGTSVKHDL